MQKVFTEKDKRQFQAIQESLEQRGRTPRVAKRVAGKTVNKRRRQEGRTLNKKTKGMGSPKKRLEDRTRDEVYNVAREMDIDNRSKMKKGELISAIRSERAS